MIALLAAALAIVFFGWVIQTVIDMASAQGMSPGNAPLFWKVVYGIGVAIWFAALVVLIGFATVALTIIVSALALLLTVIALAYAYLVAVVVLSCVAIFKVYELMHLKIIPDDHAIGILRACAEPVFPSP